MTVVDDALAGTASGVNNGIARIAGLFAVAALGIVAAFVYRAGLDPAIVPGSFGEPMELADAAARSLRMGAMLRAFVALSLATAVLSFSQRLDRLADAARKGRRARRLRFLCHFRSTRIS